MQEEFALGLGEVHRARAAEKVRGTCQGRLKYGARPDGHTAPCTTKGLATSLAIHLIMHVLKRMAAPTCRHLLLPLLPQTTFSYLCSPPPQVKEGTKEVAHKTGEALSSAATAVGHQVGRWVGEKGKKRRWVGTSGRREGKRGRWVGYAALRAV